METFRNSNVSGHENTTEKKFYSFNGLPNLIELIWSSRENN